MLLRGILRGAIQCEVGIITQVVGNNDVQTPK